MQIRFASRQNEHVDNLTGTSLIGSYFSSHSESGCLPPDRQPPLISMTVTERDSLEQSEFNYLAQGQSGNEGPDTHPNLSQSFRQRMTEPRERKHSSETEADMTSFNTGANEKKKMSIAF